ncbi:pro-neuropeptide Y-like [Argiope bruennichi]|uniref:Pro-neuropeptide Y like protein n=1 Tax=Argiope bruennichi TaxID=94029 RepID=A0A8T0E246_ARGBR|nr:pro-neuropeptide Y-like [Argiope bruennichi]KAF8764513.1 Pro-neuropeptide Y like protein [Argiope bruennichi]
MTMLGLLVISTLLCAIAVQASINNGEQGEIIAELPTQPMVFNTPDELRTYLQELDKYFAIVGRPRFGRTLGNGYSRNIYPYFRTNPLAPPSF